MTTEGSDDRSHTLHGEPVSLTSYVPESGADGNLYYPYPQPPYPQPPYSQPPMPPRKGGSGVLIAIVVVAVLLLGAGGVLAWMLVRDGGGGDAGTEAGAPQDTAVVTLTDDPSPAEAPQTEAPQIEVPQTVTPPAGGGDWYAQLGAFNEYGNAAAAVARNPGSVMLPGSNLGLSTRYVVVQRVSSRAEAQAVCSRFAEGDCYVRSGE
ncbi:SPOR domain-containing protein [Gordonia sp. (in: high G+C Gram-positive bacteria)]|uniref:SPOR domain-containing protein n=1 Tax=Gordonia sp. (in: high G+C Gram-positive bacteria) TaxID=84139 RepID=UPI0016A1BB59|nr:SPOR domain-containing protein [Gordonia sp. (in: high G+C Gram-positive bacteria)]NLG47308.1 SPOR domain-containing protein [Gordonia sp. (in: high G+C Gram-positive bacteria)]